MPFPVNNIREVCKEKTSLAEVERALNIGNGVIAKTRLSRAKEAYLGSVLSLEEYAEIKAAAGGSIAKLEAARDKDNGTAAVDVAAYSARVLQVLDVVRADGVSGEAKNQALRSIIDKIIFKKAGNTFDFFFLP